MDANRIEAQAAGVILDRGVRYKLGEDSITIRPLRFGTCILLAGKVAEAGLSDAELQKGRENVFPFFAAYAELMLTCVAVAELNCAEKLTEEAIAERTAFYREQLTAFQVYELFVHVLALSGMRDFMSTISLLLKMKTATLGPKMQGSQEAT
jgi:hypothetical protein